jgi:hypothetical protein
VGIAVTADIIGSRQLADRAEAQRAFDETIARVESALPLAEVRLHPTVGDEQQGVYPTLPAALASILLLRLALPEGIEFRYGIGIGEIGVIASEASSAGIPEGPGWWAARQAIEHVGRLERRSAPHARTWVVAHGAEGERSREDTRMANAYLLARDEIVGAMSARARRLTYGRCLGVRQGDLADDEGITQSAVSQALAAAGAASVVEGFRLLVDR